MSTNPSLRSAAGWSLVALLVVVFSVNIHTALNPDLFPEIASNLLYICLVFQLIFIYWAYSAMRPSIPVVLITKDKSDTPCGRTG